MYSSLRLQMLRDPRGFHAWYGLRKAGTKLQGPLRI